MSDDRETIDKGELTTADLADRRPESRGEAESLEEPRREPERFEESQRVPERVEQAQQQQFASDEVEDEAPDALFPDDEVEQLRGRWTSIQGNFVDEPRRAVEDADGLVAAAIKRVAETFADERSRLESQWDRGDDVSTEDLRIALRRYRAFFDRILSM